MKLLISDSKGYKGRFLTIDTVLSMRKDVLKHKHIFVGTRHSLTMHFDVLDVVPVCVCVCMKESSTVRAVVNLIVITFFFLPFCESRQ